MAKTDRRDPNRLKLTRFDIDELLHHDFYIAKNHGHHQRLMERRYPGWEFEEVVGLIRSDRRVVTRTSSRVSGRTCRADVIEIEIGRSALLTIKLNVFAAKPPT